MELQALIISLFIGIGLATATGFRIFTPFFLLSLATNFNWIPIQQEWSWIGSQTALITTSVAMIVETIAYFIPFIDNLLDTISIPLASVAGSVLFASQFNELSPLIQWSIAIIAGGGTAALIGTSFAGTRAASSAGTAGIGNPILSTIETIGSGIISILSIFAPIIAAIIVAIVLFFIIKISRKLKAKIVKE